MKRKTKQGLKKELELMQKTVGVQAKCWERTMREKERAIDTCVGLENEIARLKDEICGLEDKLAEISHENEDLREALRLSDEALADCEGDYQKAKKIFDGLRWRIYTLLRSADQDGETFGLPKMTFGWEKSETEGDA